MKATTNGRLFDRRRVESDPRQGRVPVFHHHVAFVSDRLDPIVEEAKKRIRNLPSEDRLSMISDFVIGSSEGDDGVLIVSEKDKGGITDAFLKELSSKTNSTITLSDKAGDFDVGCILICGDCEYNGTLEARSDDLESDIRDAVNQALFSKK